MTSSIASAERSPPSSAATGARPRTICHRSTNTPGFVHGVDGRSKLMRRRRDLIALFVDELGGEANVSQAAMLGVIRAADATAIAEEYRTRALRGGPIVMDDLVRLENTAARAVKALGIKGRQPKPASPLAAHFANPPAREVRG